MLGSKHPGKTGKLVPPTDPEKGAQMAVRTHLEAGDGGDSLSPLRTGA